MSLSVDKFTSLRKASLLGQAKDAISAIKEKKPPISPQKGIATKQLPPDQCDTKNAYAFVVMQKRPEHNAFDSF